MNPADKSNIPKKICTHLMGHLVQYYAAWQVLGLRVNGFKLTVLTPSLNSVFAEHKAPKNLLILKQWIEDLEWTICLYFYN